MSSDSAVDGDAAPDKARPCSRAWWHSVLFGRRQAIVPDHLIVWDSCLACLIFTYVCFYRPYTVTYAYGPWSWWDWTIEVIFWIDIVICSQTAYLAGGYRIVVDSSRVFRHYLRGWFLCDFVATIPWDAVVKSALPENAHPKTPVLQLLALSSVLRVMRAPRIVHRLTAEWTMHTAKRAFLVYAAFTCLVAHIMACLFYLCPAVFAGGEEKLATCDGGSACSWRVAHGLNHMTRQRQYLISLYWSFTTMTTLGYGDVVPLLPPEMVMGIFAELIGAGAFALLVMHIQNCYDAIMNDEGLDLQQRNDLTIYLDQMSVKPALKKKIMRYLSYEANLHTYSSFNDEDPRFSRLTRALKLELRVEIFSPILKRNEVFNKIPANLTTAMAERIQSRPCSPGERFIEPGTYGNCAYILLAGKAKVADVAGASEFSTLRWSDPNNVVAITSLLDDEVRDSLASLTRGLYAEAVDHCSLAFIHRDVFRETVLPTCPKADKLLLEILATQTGIDSHARSQTVWVGGIPMDYCEATWLTAHMSVFGDVAFVTCRRKPPSDKAQNRSWALVSFWDDEDAKAAAASGTFTVHTKDCGEITLKVHMDENATKTRALAIIRSHRRGSQVSGRPRRRSDDEDATFESQRSFVAAVHNSKLRLPQAPTVHNDDDDQSDYQNFDSSRRGGAFGFLTKAIAGIRTLAADANASPAESSSSGGGNKVSHDAHETGEEQGF